MTVKELKAELKKLDVEFPASAKKADLEALLAEAQGAAGDPPADAPTPAAEGPSVEPEVEQGKKPRATGSYYVLEVKKGVGRVVAPHGLFATPELPLGEATRTARRHETKRAAHYRQRGGGEDAPIEM